MKLTKTEKEVLDAMYVEVSLSNAYRPGIYEVNWQKKLRIFKKLIIKLKKL